MDATAASCKTSWQCMLSRITRRSVFISVPRKILMPAVAEAALNFDETCTTSQSCRRWWKDKERQGCRAEEGQGRQGCMERQRRTRKGRAVVLRKDSKERQGYSTR